MNRKRNNGKYIVRTVSRRTWLESAGVTMTADTISPPRAHTTQNICEAMRFKTYRQAEAMKQLLIDKYGLKTAIVEV